MNAWLSLIADRLQQRLMARQNQYLIPNDLLHMKSNVIMPLPNNFTSNELYSKLRWKRVQFLANLFWQRWRSECLQDLQLRHKWNAECKNVSVGDVVLMVDDSVNRSYWRLGRVTECLTSKDGLVRSVNVRAPTENKAPIILKRPINKIIVLIEHKQKGYQKLLSCSTHILVLFRFVFHLFILLCDC